MLIAKYSSDGKTKEYLMIVNNGYREVKSFDKSSKDCFSSRKFHNGAELHYLNGKYHREDGPAHISIHRTAQYWYYHGKLHRADGPAYYNGIWKEFYLNGVRLSKKEFLRIQGISEGQLNDQAP